MRPCITLLVLILASACSSTTSEGKPDIQPIDGAPLVDGQAEDGIAIDTAPKDVYVPEPGEFLYPCTDNEECYSGWCIPTKDGTLCTKTCLEECPEGWDCRPLVTEGDPVYLCLPRWLHLCDPCTETADCGSDESDAGHYCLDHGPKGKFCGGECESDGLCPPGYECKDVPVGGGLVKKQCVPAAGDCECSKLAVDLQLSTQCVISSDVGICVGKRQCTPSGLSACDAKDPGPETCNGLDDDCDGATDNLPVDYECLRTNEHGSCIGKGTCIGGVELCEGPDALPEICDGLDNDCNTITDDGFVDTDLDGAADCVDEDDDDDTIPDASDNCPVDPNLDQENYDGDEQGDACDDDDDNDGVNDGDDCEPKNGAVHPGAVEACDGVDNDCNGEIDDNLCDDGNSCTIDGCNADGSCAHEADNSQLCDDGSICSQVDKCVDGVCEGLNPILCDDGNPCTDDSCDAVAGCLTAFNTSGCEDGSQCTINDTCANGTCQPGPNKDCDDGSPCTLDQCDPKQGCKYQPTNEGVGCNKDGLGQCQASKCQAGQCAAYNVDGVGCNTGKGDCPSGTCSGGSCFANAGTVCSTEVGFFICEEDVPGVCDSNGKCTPTKGSCQCTGACSSFCLCCFGVELCLDFLF